MKIRKENTEPSEKKKKEHERSPLVTETNPEGAKYDKKGPNADPPKGKLVDGDSTSGGGNRD